MIKIVISGDTPSKKNSKAIAFVGGRPRIFPGKVHRAWTAPAAAELEAWKIQNHFEQNFGIITGADEVILKFFPKTRRKSDLTNKAESIMDLLVDCQLIEDDNWHVIKKITLEFGGVDPKKPRCEITIK